MWREWGRWEMHTELWRGTLKERDHLEDIDVDWSVILKEILKKYNKSA
jgi:hypothetical protein